jgi:hypothetical protein
MTERQPRILSDASVWRAEEKNADYGQRALAPTALARGSVGVTGAALVLVPLAAIKIDIPVARREVAVGERISLDLEFLLQSHRILGAEVKSIRWKIPGRVVKKYDLVHRRTRVVLLSAADMAEPTIAFYWVDSGDAREVVAECTLANRALQTELTVLFQATFDVKAPALGFLREYRAKKKRGQTRMGTNLASQKGQLFLEFTGTVKKREKAGVRRHHGTVWYWRVTVPQGHDGQVTDLQTIYGIREQTLLLGTGEEGKAEFVWKPENKPLVERPGADPPEGYLIVDSTPAEDPTKPRYSGEFPIDVGAEGTTEITGHDSPSSLLPPMAVRLFVHEKFKYFVLYRPKTKGAIWVPVAKVEWYWKAEALRPDEHAEWTLHVAEGGISSAGARTLEFPEYNAHRGEMEWEERQP